MTAPLPAPVDRIGVRLGIPLKDVATALATLPDDRTPTCDDWQRLTRSWRADLDRLVDPGDVLSAAGPGPRIFDT